MPSAEDLISRPGSVSVPQSYTVPANGAIIPLVITATMDGSSATGSFLAVVEIVAQTGVVVAYCRTPSAIAAGASAAVSWFPGGDVEEDTSSTVPGGTISDIASPGGTLTVTAPSGPTTSLDLAASGVSAGTYGDATHVSEITVDADGRVTSATSVPISGSGGAGGLIVLYDSGYLGADTASIDTGAAGIASGHFCLRVIAYLRSTAAATNDNVNLTLNNDSSALYNLSRIQANNAAIANANAGLATAIAVGIVPGASATAGLFGSLDLTMPAYDATTNFKSGHSIGEDVTSTVTTSLLSIYGFAYQSTAAISRLKLAPSTGGASFKAGSRMIVYGTQ